MAAAGTVAGNIIDGLDPAKFALAYLITPFLPVFQIVFPGLVFPLAMLFLDVSIFSQIAHRQARRQLSETVDSIDPNLQPNRTGPDFQSTADVLNERYRISLDRIWLFRLALFLYAPALGLRLPFLTYFFVQRMRGGDIFYSPQLNIISAVGAAISLSIFWLTVAGIRAAAKVRTNHDTLWPLILGRNRPS